MDANADARVAGIGQLQLHAPLQSRAPRQAPTAAAPALDPGGESGPAPPPLRRRSVASSRLDGLVSSPALQHALDIDPSELYSGSSGPTQAHAAAAGAPQQVPASSPAPEHPPRTGRPAPNEGGGGGGGGGSTRGAQYAAALLIFASPVLQIVPWTCIDFGRYDRRWQYIAFVTACAPSCLMFCAYSAMMFRFSPRRAFYYGVPYFATCSAAYHFGNAALVDAFPWFIDAPLIAIATPSIWFVVSGVWSAYFAYRSFVGAKRNKTLPSTLSDADDLPAAQAEPRPARRAGPNPADALRPSKTQRVAPAPGIPALVLPSDDGTPGRPPLPLFRLAPLSVPGVPPLESIGPAPATPPGERPTSFRAWQGEDLAARAGQEGGQERGPSVQAAGGEAITGDALPLRRRGRRPSALVRDGRDLESIFASIREAPFRPGTTARHFGLRRGEPAAREAILFLCKVLLFLLTLCSSAFLQWGYLALFAAFTSNAVAQIAINLAFNFIFFVLSFFFVRAFRNFLAPILPGGQAVVIFSSWLLYLHKSYRLAMTFRANGYSVLAVSLATEVVVLLAPLCIGYSARTYGRRVVKEVILLLLGSGRRSSRGGLERGSSRARLLPAGDDDAGSTSMRSVRSARSDGADGARPPSAAAAAAAAWGPLRRLWRRPRPQQLPEAGPYTPSHPTAEEERARAAVAEAGRSVFLLQAGISVAASAHFAAWLVAARYGPAASIWPFHPAVLPREDFVRTLGAAGLSAAVVCGLVAAVYLRAERLRRGEAGGPAAPSPSPGPVPAGSVGRQLVLSNAATVATMRAPKERPWKDKGTVPLQGGRP